LLITHLLLIATVTGMSFANFMNVRIARGQSGEAAMALQGLRRLMGMFGDMIIAGIWVTGLSLAWMRVAAGEGDFNAAFHVKMALVVLLTACHFMARRAGGQIARTGNYEAHLNRLELWLAGMWLAAAIAIIMAVLAFGM
jgi:uncharacterized membrane protein